MQATFPLDKETAAKFRFGTQEGDVTGSLYIPKDKAADVKAVKVTIEFVK
jgi:hypothetical protein